MNKNRLMVAMAAGSSLLTVFVYFLHRFGVIQPMGSLDTGLPEHPVISMIACILPIVLAIGTYLLYWLNNKHVRVPLMVTLTLAFSSIGTVISGGGMVEYHFSIFMVVAILAYYEDSRLLALMTALFAVEHLLGFLSGFWTPIIFGVSHYGFPMLCLHVVYLVLTTGATSLQISYSKRHATQLKKENEKNQRTLNQLKEKLVETSQQVLKTVEALSKNATQTQQATLQITSSIQQMAGGAETQLERTFESGTLLIEMANSVNQIAENSSVIVEAAGHASKDAELGKTTIYKTRQQMDTIHHEISELARMVEGLKKRSIEINRVISVISDLSEQTNLLALNAAIEASRAGDSGRGFAVVADEIRKLAIKSKDSVSDVIGLISEVQSETAEANMAMEKGSLEVEKGNRFIYETELIFDEVLKSINKVYDQIHEAAGVSEELAASSDHVLMSVNAITELAKETAISSEGISKESETQLYSMDKIHTISDHLSSLMTQLNELALTLNNKV